MRTSRRRWISPAGRAAPATSRAGPSGVTRRRRITQPTARPPWHKHVRGSTSSTPSRAPTVGPMWRRAACPMSLRRCPMDGSPGGTRPTDPVIVEVVPRAADRARAQHAGHVLSRRRTDRAAARRLPGRPGRPARRLHRVRAQDVEAMLAATNRGPVAPGDTVLCPGGTPHAIGAGILLIELQEPTDWSVIMEWRGFPLGPGDVTPGLPLDEALACVDRRACPPRRVNPVPGPPLHPATRSPLPPPPTPGPVS